ncbi:lachrymatory-factor synthase-like [Dioscorea cayenensis subsp. rotundata]|uniref:Lachrymatory-factor synthase-like n=1 Tax=Dioscorea cayennensis subsp. rotundata TaxID=55577 RepID=A0AB40CP22_DIOCR|nr:lachrymatory-factor synthase-like [Dioscorea cayenensis subsp. rotundata]
MISICRLVEGVPGKPGCVRYCSDVPPTDNVAREARSNPWVKERLLSLDPIGQSLSYEITKNNMGFIRYMAKLKMVGGGGGHDDGNEDGCNLEWCFEVDPVVGFSEKGFLVA